LTVSLLFSFLQFGQRITLEQRQGNKFHSTILLVCVWRLYSGEAHTICFWYASSNKCKLKIR